MRPIQRRRLEPKARRQEILEAAERLLKARGAAVRVDDVVHEAKAAKGTFYLYFASWDDLLEALRSRIFDSFDKAYPVPGTGDGPIDWPRLFDRLSRDFANGIVGLGGLHDAIFHGEFARRRPLPTLRHPVSRLAELIRAGQRAQALADVDPEPTARLLFAVIHETADAVIDGSDRRRALAAMRRVVRSALAPG